MNNILQYTYLCDSGLAINQGSFKSLMNFKFGKKIEATRWRQRNLHQNSLRLSGQKQTKRFNQCCDYLIINTQAGSNFKAGLCRLLALLGRYERAHLEVHPHTAGHSDLCTHINHCDFLNGLLKELQHCDAAHGARDTSRGVRIIRRILCNQVKRV